MSNKNIMTTIGARNFAKEQREENDFYATDPIAIDKLEKSIHVPKYIWECSCGQGHLSERLKIYGHKVFSSDLYNRGYGCSGIDFLSVKNIKDVVDFEIYEPNDFCILTNPPFKCATEFVLHAFEIMPVGSFLFLFLKTTFLEGKKRHEHIFSKIRPRYVLQFIERVDTAKNGDFIGLKNSGGSAVSYAWFVWQKLSNENFEYDTIIDWI